MVKSNIENMKRMLWRKKPFPTKEYILCCILEELREINEKPAVSPPKMSQDMYKQCADCYHNVEKSPCACDSCEQPSPTNYGEVPPPVIMDPIGREKLDAFLLDCAEITQEEREAMMEFAGAGGK